MGFRPLSPTWLEIWLPKNAQSTLLESLALSKRFALSGSQAVLVSASQQQLIENYQVLKEQYQRLWPAPIFDPEQTLDQAQAAWQRLFAWQEAAKSFYGQFKQWQSAWEQCLRWQALSQYVSALADLPLAYVFRSENSHLRASIVVLPESSALPWETFDDVLWQRLGTSIAAQRNQRPLACYFVIGKAAAIDALCQKDFPATHFTEYPKTMQSFSEGCWRVPEGLTAQNNQAQTLGEALWLWQSALETQRNQLAYQEQALHDHHDLARSLAILDRLQWFIKHAASDSASHYFIKMTGWFQAPSPLAARAELIELLPDIPYLLTTPDPPAGVSTPVILHNPPWIKPFEWFVKAIGMPDKNQIDPSLLLALLVPLLFGYMFGDVGQGAILAGVGFYFRKTALGRLLLLAGISSMFFGFLYGKIFTLEGILPPLWLSPLKEPLPLLLVPLFFAMGLLSLGLFFNVLQQWWARSAEFWPSLGFWFLYSSLALSLWQGFFVWLAIPALALIVFGRGLGHLGAALGELLENSLQLAMNTLSFIRVGAFSLAHAGLSSMVSTLALGAPWWAAVLFLFLGNLFIILLDGLLVSIQTTRLMLFEFFTRFFKGSGRAFVALTLPHWAYRS